MLKTAFRTPLERGLNGGRIDSLQQDQRFMGVQIEWTVPRLISIIGLSAPLKPYRFPRTHEFAGGRGRAAVHPELNRGAARILDRAGAYDAVERCKVNLLSRVKR
jgi:hypothetical protein